MICVPVRELSELNAQPPVRMPSASTSIVQTIVGSALTAIVSVA